MTTRQEKVSSLIQRQIGAFLRDAAYEDISGFLTITSVDVSADLEHAKVYFSVLGQDWEEVLAALNKHVYEIQGTLNQNLKMRKLPRIVFIPDHSGEYSQRIYKVMKDLRDDK